MQIFGGKALTSDQLWQIYTQIIKLPDIWHAASFADAAKDCGYKRVSKKISGSFSFNASNFTTGQAIINQGFVEEIRLFIGNGPKDLE